MQKNDTWRGVCEDYTYEGAGVVHAGDIVFFVPGLLRGEEAELAVTAMKKNYGYARIVNLLKASEHRVQPACSVYKRCGGCQLMHMDKEEQGRFKEEKVIGVFRMNACMDIQPLPILTTEHVTQYRNKVQVPVQVVKDQVQMGFYENRSNTIVPFENCLVQTSLSNEIVQNIKASLSRNHCGKEVRHVLIKHAHNSGQVMVCLIVRSWPFHNAERFTEQLLKDFPQIKSLSCIINRREDNVILDGKQVQISGLPYIEEQLLGCTFRISARSFYQINPYATEVLYSTALEYAGLTGKETVIDLYCGTGTIGILASKHAGKVIGIEIVADAVKDARVNAEINGCTNIDFFTADAKVGAKRLNESHIHPDVVIVDPPRKGCSRETIDGILTMNPEKIVYVSCDPSTLARDVRIFSDHGYELKKVQPVDMFPGTLHVETVVKLSQHMSTNYVDLDVDMSEFYPTSAETKATYEDIKKYVLNKFGYKVSNLYISQVKRKNGIIERASYNHRKSDKNHVPQCPVEKEAAIVDALKHFQMI